MSQARITYKVMPGQKVVDGLPKDVLYKFPDFLDGVVHFRNGAVGIGKMNFNHLIGKVQFIDDKNDTLELNNDPPIKYVTLATDTFYFDKSWMCIFHSGKRIMLAKSVMLYLVNRQRKGAMGIITEGSVNPVTQLSLSSRPLTELVTDEILTFALHTEFYIADRFGLFRPANKKGFTSLFGTKKNEIEKYLDKEPVNFLKEDDLLKLARFIDQLY